MAVGATPRARCSSVAISGTRLAPPTRKTSSGTDSGRAARRIADFVVFTVRSRSGRTNRSNWARPSGTSCSSSGTKITVLDARDSISLAVRTSSQSWRRARLSWVVAGCSRRAQTDSVSSAMAPRKPMTAASMSRPPMSARPSETRTSKPAAEPPVERATTLTSNVPAPRSYTTRLPGWRCSSRTTASKYDAAAIGSGTNRGSRMPAAVAASSSVRLRCSPHAAGQAMVTSSAAPPATDEASAATRRSTSAMSVETGTSADPSSTEPSSMRCFGFGS
jgi:hypothetical protein